MRIDLSFTEFLDLELIEKGIVVLNVRVVAQTTFRTSEGWLASRDAIVDLGSPVSVLPQDIWKTCAVRDLTDYEVRGVVPREECVLKGRLGKIDCVIHDERNEAPPLSLTAFLAPIVGIPLILGFYELLTMFDLHCSYTDKKAWLETKMYADLRGD